MVVAIPIFGAEVAPRFCFAEESLVVRLESGRETERRRIDMRGASGPDRLRRLADLGVGAIVCCGFDRRLLPLARTFGIVVDWGCTGDFEAAIARAAKRAFSSSPGKEPRHRAGQDGAPRLRLAIATSEPVGLDGSLGAHFGHCRYMALVDVTGDDVDHCRVVETPSASGGPHGAMPQFVAALGACVVIAGGMGPRAVGRLQQLGVEATTSSAHTVREAVKAYLSGSLGDVAPCGYQVKEGGARCGALAAKPPRDGDLS